MNKPNNPLVIYKKFKKEDDHWLREKFRETHFIGGAFILLHINTVDGKVAFVDKKNGEETPAFKEFRRIMKKHLRPPISFGGERVYILQEKDTFHFPRLFELLNKSLDFFKNWKRN
jgi:hypothetical protein